MRKLRVTSQKSCSEQVVRLAAAHSLLQAVDALVALPRRKPLEDLSQQRSHTVSDVCLFEEALRI